jgi:hypothetical protein
MNHELQFERVQPHLVRWGNADTLPWVIVLSEWIHGNTQQLAERVEGVLGAVDYDDALPTIFVIDDVGERDEGHWKLLTGLTEAGAIILEPENDAVGDIIQEDPVSFVRQQIAIAAQAPTGAEPEALEPGKPDGYREFATPYTRLSEKDLEDVIEGRLPPDWRYEV